VRVQEQSLDVVLWRHKLNKERIESIKEELKKDKSTIATHLGSILRWSS
jgi:hypothetical protein